MLATPYPNDLRPTAYQRAVQHLELPSDKQIEEFVGHVASAQSYYRHLAPFPDGSRLLLFVDPYAGHSVTAGPPRRFIPRVRAEDCLSPSELTTADHLARFGPLRFRIENAADGPGLAVNRQNAWPGILGPRETWIPLPEPFRGHATTEVTAFLSPRVRAPFVQRRATSALAAFRARHKAGEDSPILRRYEPLATLLDSGELGEAYEAFAHNEHLHLVEAATSGLAELVRELRERRPRV